VAHGPLKKPLNFGGNRGHVTVRLELVLRIGAPPPYCAWKSIILCDVCLIVVIILHQRP